MGDSEGDMPATRGTSPHSSQAPYPRPWQRVAVAPASAQHRQRKIWKRVGGLGTASGSDAYSRAIAELDQQGQYPRKRARQGSHIPVWGEAKWDAKAERRVNSQHDLLAARAAVTAAEQEAVVNTATDHTRTRPATFPEERLKWVPRKRHNSRWPIEPSEEKADSMASNPSSPVNSKAPRWSQTVDVAVQINGDQLKRRSMRRLSRRYSIFPGEESPGKLPTFTLSPAEVSMPVLSPVKRPPVSLSPTKVADSPLGSFRVNATPSKVVLESPKVNPPEQSPCKPTGSPNTPDDDGMHPPAARALDAASPAHTPSGPAPLMFDQPTPQASTESEHEVRRRKSLVSARRTERRSSGATRLLALKSGWGSPNRRHSFTSLGEPSAEIPTASKGRRNTMDMFSTGPGVHQVIGSTGEHDGAAGHYKATEVVEIDMKTNLDIFGQLAKPAQSDRPSLAPAAVLNPSATPPDTTRSVPSDGLALRSEETGVEAEVEDASCQPPRAAASQGVSAEIERESDKHASRSPPNFTEDQQTELTFTPHDPDGLSTIYEESTVAEVATKTELAPGSCLKADPTSPYTAPEVALQAPGTPSTIAGTSAQVTKPVFTPEAHLSAAANRAQHEISGFTPINGHHSSPLRTLPSGLQDGEEVAAADSESDDDADEVIEEDLPADEEEQEHAAALEDDNLTVCPPHPLNDTLQLQAMHDDSETEMLRKFVTRVTADKNAKAAAAAAALTKKSARAAARRSGSLGSSSTTSSTGSPMARPQETNTAPSATRQPLVEKSANSPSPTKKRKLVLFAADDDDDLSKPHPRSSPSSDPHPKRRRNNNASKRTDTPHSTTTTNNLSTSPSPEPSSPSNLHIRRSTRTRRLRPTAPSANAIALSMIPVRLPGMGAMDDNTITDVPHLGSGGGMARQRAEGRDLAAVTRANTRKNKGGAVPPALVLARQAEDGGWRMRELKGVFEAREKRKGGGEGCGGEGEGEGAGDGRKSRRGKGVRWAEELVRFQLCEEGQELQQASVFRGLARGLLADVVRGDGGMEGEDGGVDEIAEAEPPKALEPVVEKTARVVGGRKAAAGTTTTTTRRTRSSRLPPPTPVAKMSSAGGAAAEKAAAAADKVAAAAAAPSLRTRAKSLPKLASASAAPAVAPSSSAAAPAASAARPASTRSSGMATRRTKIAKLGMSANGTPAPKRRGRAI